MMLRFRVPAHSLVLRSPTAAVERQREPRNARCAPACPSLSTVCPSGAEGMRATVCVWQQQQHRTRRPGLTN
eukprot:2281801-Rhodomonas_salina.3